MSQESFIPLFHEVGSGKSGFCKEQSKYKISWSAYKDFLAMLLEYMPGVKLLTFDDGGYSNYEAAIYAASLGFRVKLFICPAYIGAEGFLSEKDLRRLDLIPEIDVCSHSFSHPDGFNFLNKFKKSEELLESRASLEEILERPVLEFSFPGGLATNRDVKLAKNIYDKVYTSWRVVYCDSVGMRRVSIEKTNIDLIISAIEKKRSLYPYLLLQDMKLVIQLVCGNIFRLFRTQKNKKIKNIS